jgi:hypothetical protein
VSSGPLTERQLAHRSGSTTRRVRGLVVIGVLHPSSGGHFEPGDVQRVQIVNAYERAGIELKQMADAISQRRMSFEYTDRIYPEASPPSGRTFAEFVKEAGHRGA